MTPAPTLIECQETQNGLSVTKQGKGAERRVINLFLAARISCILHFSLIMYFEKLPTTVDRLKCNILDRFDHRIQQIYYPVPVNTMLLLELSVCFFVLQMTKTMP